jgi:type II secretory pathway pseudopilin PulG
LIELLMVVLIMGILGSITVGGYRAMQRGMEERGVMENVNHFIRSAYRRAQIDRQPVAVFFWNEMLRAETDTDPMIVVGKAVAVRRAGRISRVSGPQLYDEFSDLDKDRLIVDTNDEEEDNSSSGSTEKDNLVPLYKMNSRSGCGRSLVSQTTVNVSTQNKDTLLSSMQVREIPCYAYVLQDAGTSGGWQAGDAYGLEFEEIQLPHNYIFGSSYPKQAGGRPQTTMIWFDVSLNSGSGSAGGATGNSTIQVYSLRPGESGTLEPQVVASSDKPTEGIH